ncbi:MAG: S-layer homology domain-containing protein [Acidimicrobiia bacterium]|nr:S-layer homology domain-containing protein [Acidimicrobiia bacterium]
MRGTRLLSVVALATLMLLPSQIAYAVCEFNGRDTVMPGVFSSQWNSTADIVAFNTEAGFPVTFAGTFHNLYEGVENTNWILQRVWDAGAVPVAHLEAPLTSAQIASGAFDADLEAWALGFKRWLDADPSHVAIVAPLQEMNGNWVPWGMDPLNYRNAYRRIVDLFRSLGVTETQVRWMFAPNGVSVFPYSATDYWPGGDVVDIVGLSAYNFGHEFGAWSTVDDVLFDTTEQLKAFARDKPFMISQVGTSVQGGDREGWLTDMFDFVARDANHVGFIYFNFDKETNWTVWDGDTVAPGWLAALEDDRVTFGFPLDDWFRPGPIPFSLSPSTAYPRPSVFCGEGSVVSPPTFSDVSDGLFYSGPISWLANAGLATGFEDGTFRPDASVTRAEAVTMLWRLACAPTDVPDSTFADVDADWYRTAVSWAVGIEAVRGYPDETFRPDAPLTRGELSTMLWRVNDCPDGTRPHDFTDVFARSFYGGAVHWMVDQQIATGTAPDRFDPDAPVTRGELATFLFRMPQGSG